LEILRCACDRGPSKHGAKLHGADAGQSAVPDQVPYLVKKCIAEIDKRGLTVKVSFLQLNV